MEDSLGIAWRTGSDMAALSKRPEPTLHFQARITQAISPPEILQDAQSYFRTRP
jgi:hypothetical protein